MVVGVDFEPPSNDVFKALAIKYNGNITKIATELKVTPVTIYRYFKIKPEAKEIIDFVRGYNTFTDLDLAEHVNRSNMMDYEQNPSIAQRAAEFTLDYKGAERGWDKQKVALTPNDSEIDKGHSLIRENGNLRDENETLKQKMKELEQRLNELQ